MKPLILLLVVFITGVLTATLITGDPQLTFNGNLAMALMFCFTALGHFKFKKGMVMMLPAFLPYRAAAVLISGIAEIVLGLALLFPATRMPAAVALLVMLVLMLPANIYAAINRVNYETGELNGKGPSYLWFRIPMQFFLAGWLIYFSMLR